MSGDNNNAFIAIINNGGNTNVLSPSSIMEIVLTLLSPLSKMAIILTILPITVIVFLLSPLSIMAIILTLLSLTIIAFFSFSINNGGTTNPFISIINRGDNTNDITNSGE